ncbi:ankyrin repeat domain-containing protein [Burkholderia contaminans]|uniref:ankyrin repeat domain-containing protein n=1 Tax=Burkholderia contaminans TaxID=488447 RepID=UPI0015896DD2|nr:ankyrin repeat domain-containing protein [Burkholderia contaminans]
MDDGHNAIMESIKNRYRKDALRQIANGVDVNFEEAGRTPVVWACDFGDMELLIALDEAGARFDKQEALKQAAYNGYSQIVSFLVEKGMDIHHNEEEALRKALENGKFDTAELLLSLGASSEVAINHMEGNESLRDFAFSVVMNRESTMDGKIEWLKETATKMDLAMKLKNELNQPGKADRLVASINEDAEAPVKKSKSHKQKI